MLDEPVRQVWLWLRKALNAKSNFYYRIIKMGRTWSNSGNLVSVPLKMATMTECIPSAYLWYYHFNDSDSEVTLFSTRTISSFHTSPLPTRMSVRAQEPGVEILQFICCPFQMRKPKFQAAVGRFSRSDSWKKWSRNVARVDHGNVLPYPFSASCKARQAFSYHSQRNFKMTCTCINGWWLVMSG